MKQRLVAIWIVCDLTLTGRILQNCRYGPLIQTLSVWLKESSQRVSTTDQKTSAPLKATQTSQVFWTFHTFLSAGCLKGPACNDNDNNNNGIWIILTLCFYQVLLFSVTACATWWTKVFPCVVLLFTPSCPHSAFFAPLPSTLPTRHFLSH